MHKHIHVLSKACCVITHTVVFVLYKAWNSVSYIPVSSVCASVDMSMEIKDVFSVSLLCVKVQANQVGKKKKLSKIRVENVAVKASRHKLFIKVSHR